MVKILEKSVVNKKMRRHFHRFWFVNSEKDSSVGEGFGPPAHHPPPPTTSSNLSYCLLY